MNWDFIEIAKARAAGPRALLFDDYLSRKRRDEEQVKPMDSHPCDRNWEPTEVLFHAQLRSGRVRVLSVVEYLL